jgi:hypothetical protein
MLGILLSTFINGNCKCHAGCCHFRFRILSPSHGFTIWNKCSNHDSVSDVIFYHFISLLPLSLSIHCSSLNFFLSHSVLKNWFFLSHFIFPARFLFFHHTVIILGEWSELFWQDFQFYGVQYPHRSFLWLPYRWTISKYLLHILALFCTAYLLLSQSSEFY